MVAMTTAARPTPPRALLANAGIVFAGGAIGAGLRGILLHALPLGGEPALLSVNLSGALALAWLTAWALRDARRERRRLLLGTGLCGGYTSYSGILLAPAGALAPVQLAWLPMAALTVALGIAASALGWWLGSRGAAAAHAAEARDGTDAPRAADQERPS